MLLPGAQLHGCDIDAEAIAWCHKYLNEIGSFCVNEFDPPLPYHDASFNLVIGISVFTHLPEAQQIAWLKELRRITHRDGLLLLSVQSERLVPERFKVNPSGHTFIDRGATEGLPDFYRCAFHNEAYIRKRWGAIFSKIAIISRGANNHQDLVICSP
jgi:ubiquinone/menaquinone biosynthesis C-methylase UbiE